MLRTRLWMGALLILLAAGVLRLDPEPYYPLWLALLTLLSVLAVVELRRLLPHHQRPPLAVVLPATLAVLLANWPAHLPETPQGLGPDPWRHVSGVLAAAALAAFLAEMAVFREPGNSVVRIALGVWVVVYLGLLPSFVAQLRWSDGDDRRGVACLALALFVPKCCDIGAYFTGRLLGRHKMTPVLSPKKTWEGLAGGLAAAVLTALLLNRFLVGRRPALADDWRAVGFGLTVGAAGVLGDLAESLVKRDCQRKDASQIMPGFGGVLDVIDAVLFAAPVAYWWLA